MHGEAARSRPADGANPRLTLLAYDRLTAMIMSGALPAGAIVQERRLAKALDISRTPLRDALFRLEGEGLLIRHEVGVLQVKSITLQDYGDALRVRLLIECEAARLAAGNLPPTVIGNIRARLQAVVRALGRRDGVLHRAELDGADDALHHAIADGSGNPLLAELIRTVRRRARLFGLAQRPARLRKTCTEHLAILDAVAAGDPAAASAAMARHLTAIMDDLRERLFDARPPRSTMTSSRPPRRVSRDRLR